MTRFILKGQGTETTTDALGDEITTDTPVVLAEVEGRLSPVGGTDIGADGYVIPSIFTAVMVPRNKAIFKGVTSIVMDGEEYKVEDRKLSKRKMMFLIKRFR